MKRIRENHIHHVVAGWLRWFTGNEENACERVESSQQSALRQLRFNEWHLTEVWQQRKLESMNGLSQLRRMFYYAIDEV
jgi:hypothetical protein